MLGVITKYYFTIRDLKWIQIVYQLRYKLFRPRIKSLEYKGILVSLSIKLKPPSTAISKGTSTFTFLNLRKEFKEKIDWGFEDYGLLWNYNLNYFDFLHQSDVGREDKIDMIRSFIASEKANYDPYPTSVRLINWILFVSENKEGEKKIVDSIYAQARHLLGFLEYHLLGNHLLENGFALLFAAYYFSDDRFYEKSKSILTKQLKEQVLTDGAHFELSPMYHSIIFFRVLQCISLIRSNSRFGSDGELEEFLKGQASKMLGWLKNMTFENGMSARFNDSTGGIAVGAKQLFDLAAELGLVIHNQPLSDSGYRKFRGGNYEVILDAGSLKPKYIPGHAHADIGHFVLHYNKKPFIVDTGISTYEKNERRQFERSTEAHNTVVVASESQSQMWGGFRVARKAEVIELKEGRTETIISHNGYKRLLASHRRTFIWDSKSIIVKDHVSGSRENKAYIHFYKGVNVSKDDIGITVDDCRIEIYNARSIKVEDYEYALGFNKRTTSRRLCVSFSKQLTTKLIFE